jgi:hypothetical protein
MDNAPKTKTEQAIEQIMRELDPESPRYQVLTTAKKFKSNWAELGERLVEVQRNRLYSDWGYASFDEYCSKEIHVRQQTALKLTQAFGYLKKSEPALLERDEPNKPLPDYRSIDLLREAREERGFNDEQYAALREAVIDEERSHPTIRKQFQDSVKSQQPAEEAKQDEYKAALRAARQLANALQPLPEIDARAMEAVNGLVSYLEGQVVKKAREEGPCTPPDAKPPWEE